MFCQTLLALEVIHHRWFFQLYRIMDNINCYINGVGIVSPQKTYDNNEFLPEIVAYNHNVLSCATPDFKEYINPIQLRRLSRMLRIGLTAAMICTRDSGSNKPDGIITGTGYGF